jgi:pyruvate,water dikinase
MQMQQYVLWYEQLGMQDAGTRRRQECIPWRDDQQPLGVGVSVPGGFATTAFAFNEFLELSGLNGKIHDLLDSLDVDDIAALNRAGQQIRDWVVEAPFQPALEQAVREAYDKLSAGSRHPLPCAPPPLRKTCRMRRLPVSRRPSSTCAVSMPS